jgi:hypothetical protein
MISQAFTGLNNQRKQNLLSIGFEKEVKLVEEGKCPSCKNIIRDNEFVDAKSIQEFHISGLCQNCQDITFGKTGENILEFLEKGVQ